MARLKYIFMWYEGERTKEEQTLKLSETAWKVSVIANEQDDLDGKDEINAEVQTDGLAVHITGELHEIEGAADRFLVSLVNK